jgi:hypothetical protein
LALLSLALTPVRSATPMVMCYTILVEKKVEKTQKTPKGHEIPVPSKKEFLENLKKATKSKPHSPKK